MLPGPEATVVARTAGAVAKGLKNQSAVNPEWPTFHEALMELHAILNDWCNAAVHTMDYLMARLAEDESDEREMRVLASLSNMTTSWRVTHGRSGFVEGITKEFRNRLEQPAPLTQRWRRQKRVQAKRRSLRSMMQIYCPDLLSSFEKSALQRKEWVERNRTEIGKTRDRETLQAALDETTETFRALFQVQRDLAELIRERYPMGSVPAAGDEADR
jgi:hypothetical protein